MALFLTPLWLVAVGVQAAKNQLVNELRYRRRHYEVGGEKTLDELVFIEKVVNEKLPQMNRKAENPCDYRVKFKLRVMDLTTHWNSPTFKPNHRRHVCL